MTLGTFAGIMLIIGAFFTYKGKIFLAVCIYLIADVCWAIMSYTIEDYQGAIFISIGMLLGILATIKMNTGVMRKDLKWD